MLRTHLSHFTWKYPEQTQLHTHSHAHARVHTCTNTHTHAHSFLPTSLPGQTHVRHISSGARAYTQCHPVGSQCHRDIRNSAHQHIHSTPGFEADPTTQRCAGKHLASTLFRLLSGSDSGKSHTYAFLLCVRAGCSHHCRILSRDRKAQGDGSPWDAEAGQQ